MLEKFLDMSLVQRIVVGILVGILFVFFPHMDIYFNIGNVVCQLLEGNGTYSGFFLDDGVNCQA